jgi:hypothetical protein
LRLPWADRWLLLEALVWLGLARLAVTVLPFRRIAPHLGDHMAESPEEEGAVVDDLPRVSWAVQAVSRRTPWESRCLVQAVAAQRMLRRRGIGSTLYLGVAKAGQTELEAHAWLRSGRVYLVGGQDRQRYKVVSSFADEG